MSIVNKRDVGLVLGGDFYQIRVGDQLSEEMGIGEGPLVFECGGKVYAAHIDTADGGGETEGVDSLLGEGFVFELIDTGAEVEEDDDDDGGDDDGGEEVEVVVDEEKAA